MHDLAFAKIADRVDDIRIVCEAQDIVISCSGFLLGCHVLSQVCECIALGLEICRSERDPGCGCRIDRRRVVDEILVEAALLDIRFGEIPRELIDDRGDHFDVGEFIRPSMMHVTGYKKYPR